MVVAASLFSLCLALVLRMITIDTLDALQNYMRVRTYLSGRCLEEARRVHVSQPKNASRPVYNLADNEAFIEEFEGVKLNWVHLVNKSSGNPAGTGRSGEPKKHYYQLRLLTKHQQVVRKYIEHITRRAAELEHCNQDLKVSTRSLNVALPSGCSEGVALVLCSDPSSAVNRLRLHCN